MIVEIGKVYLEPKSGMIVECIGNTAPGSLFKGKVLSPGCLFDFHPVGATCPTLSTSSFQLVGVSKESFLRTFGIHLDSLPEVTTMEAALASMGAL